NAVQDGLMMSRPATTAPGAPARAARVSVLLVTVTGAVSPVARAETATPVVHPIYAQIKDAPQNALALRRFQTATRRFGLEPVEIVDIEGDAAVSATDQVL